jgi:hypothetical protein
MVNVIVIVIVIVMDFPGGRTPPAYARRAKASAGVDLAVARAGLASRDGVVGSGGLVTSG